MRNISYTLTACIILLAAVQNSAAGTSTKIGNLNYHIALVGSCAASVSPGGTISLGTKVANAGNITNADAGTISVTCSAMPYKVCVNGGNDPASPYRQLEHTTFSGNFLKYDLKFSGTVVGDNGCDALGATTADTAAWQSPISAMGTGMLQTFPLKADVIIPANSIPGTYQDTTVAVTIVW